MSVGCEVVHNGCAEWLFADLPRDHEATGLRLKRRIDGRAASLSSLRPHPYVGHRWDGTLRRIFKPLMLLALPSEEREPSEVSGFASLSIPRSRIVSQGLFRFLANRPTTVLYLGRDVVGKAAQVRRVHQQATCRLSHEVAFSVLFRQQASRLVARDPDTAFALGCFLTANERRCF